MKRDTLYGIMTLIGATLIHHTYGFLYASGDLIPYLEGFYDSQSGAITFFTSSLFASQAISTPLGALLSKKIGFRWSTILSIVLTSGGIFLSRLTIGYGLVYLILTCSIMFGFGIGAAYSVLYAVAAAWFPNRRSLVVGIIASGLGLGAVVFVPLQTLIINPNNIDNLTDSTVTDRVPIAFLALGGLIICLQIIGFALLREKHPDLEIHVEPAITSSQNFIDLQEEMKDPTRNYTILEALSTIDFYLAFCINFFNSASVGLISCTVKLYGISSGFDKLFMAAILTTSAVFNCIGRITWGYLGDKFSFKGPMTFLQIEWAILWFTYPYITMVGGVASKVLFALWTFLLYSCLAANFVLIPNLATRIFGPKNMPTIFGLIFAAMAPSNLILSGILSTFDVKSHWMTIYSIGGSFSLISLFLLMFVKDPEVRCVACFNPLVRACDCCRRGDKERINEEKLRVAGDSDDDRKAKEDLAH